MTQQINLELPWCTYVSRHPTGFYYSGKGQTKKVLDGSYKGSGIRFKICTAQPTYEFSTWDTEILETFRTEQEAYSAEAALVPLQALADPFCLNMHMGGLKGKYMGHSMLYKKVVAAEKAVRMAAKKESKLRREEKKREQSVKRKQRESLRKEKGLAAVRALKDKIKELKKWAKN